MGLDVSLNLSMLPNAISGSSRSTLQRSHQLWFLEYSYSLVEDRCFQVTSVLTICCRQLQAEISTFHPATSYQSPAHMMVLLALYCDIPLARQCVGAGTSRRYDVIRTRTAARSLVLTHKYTPAGAQLPILTGHDAGTARKGSNG